MLMHPANLAEAMFISLSPGRRQLEISNSFFIESRTNDTHCIYALDMQQNVDLLYK